MKRITALLFILTLVATLCSCGGGKPDEMSDAMYQIGINALGVADDYIAGKITGDEAYDRLEEFHEQAEAQTKKEKEDLGVDSLYGTEFADDYFVETDILLLLLDVGSAKYGSGPMSDVKESRDKLAESLGE